MASRNFTEKAIILKKTPYKESSYILQVFSHSFGKISILAQGVRKPNNKAYGLLDILNELELVLYRKQDSDWYILKSASLISSHLYGISYEPSKYLYAASEIILQLIFHDEDNAEIYKLILDYITYQKNTDKNHIAIFWRFLMRLFDIMGIKLNFSRCSICHTQTDNIAAYSPIRKGIVCETCYRLPTFKAQSIRFSETDKRIISLFYRIGNHLDELNINNNTTITKMMLLHLQEHFEKKFTLKSLDI